jgi:hypothetical protein
MRASLLDRIQERATRELFEEHEEEEEEMEWQLDLGGSACWLLNGEEDRT